MTSEAKVLRLQAGTDPRPSGPENRAEVWDDEPAVSTRGLGKRYRRTWALRDCSLAIPRGSVVALVGPNGAGKSTFLHLTAGLSAPTCGGVEIFGKPVDCADEQSLARTAFLAQRKPLYTGFSVAEMLRFGRLMNPRWDDELAHARMESLQIPLGSRIGRLSGGQHTQVALTLTLAKQPDLLVLDEPLADLDPLARRDVLGSLMADVAHRQATVILSSHVLADLEKTCDWLIVIRAGQVLVSETMDSLLERHRVLVGPVDLLGGLADHLEVVERTLRGR